MDLSFLQEYCTPIIIGICLCVGYILKQWIKDLDNKWIPTIITGLGIVLSVLIEWENLNTYEIILRGMISGLAATGLHQAFKQILSEKGKEDGLERD